MAIALSSARRALVRQLQDDAGHVSLVTGGDRRRVSPLEDPVVPLEELAGGAGVIRCCVIVRGPLDNAGCAVTRLMSPVIRPLPLALSPVANPSP